MHDARLNEIEWAEYAALPIEARCAYMMRADGSPYHTIFAQQFGREQLDNICSLATTVRTIAKTRSGMQFLMNLLCHRRAMLYFSQPSSRTFLSFCSACRILGLGMGEVRDSATSSEFKGESCEDSVRTFSSYFDLIVLRSPEKGLAERMAWMLSNTERPVPIINAGSGRDQHPTQALLDIYTLQRSFESRGGLRDRTIVFVGDLKRGRTVRSLSCLLTQYSNITQVFVAPEALQIGEDVQAMLESRGVSFRLSDDLRATIPDADAVYMTRIQDEWDGAPGESAAIDVSRFHLAARDLDGLRPQAIIMHPFPRRAEIAVDVDRDPRAMYWRQMRNGMWVRVALMSMTFGCEQRIHAYENENF